MGPFRMVFNYNIEKFSLIVIPVDLFTMKCIYAQKHSKTWDLPDITIDSNACYHVEVSMKI
jgi:hypothetical protein